MHTSVFQIDGYDGEVRVHHHGDWSGDVIITFKEKVFGPWDTQKKPVQEAKIPGALLVALALPATQVMVAEALVRFAERLPETLGLMKAVKEAEKTDSKAEKAYNTEDDKVFGTKWVYCTQHRRVHSTGWCTVWAVDKVPLLSETEEGARKEWEIRKEKLAEDFGHDKTARKV